MERTQELKPMTLSRRSLLAAPLFAVFGRQAAAAGSVNSELYGDDPSAASAIGRDPNLFPPPESPIDFPVEPADLDSIPEQFHRQIVPWDRYEEPGSIIVDPQRRFLYLVLDSGESALRYGVGVGRAGFSWAGNATVGMKRKWPRWIPPEDMVYRDAKARKWVNGMPGGPDNPLGARALYLYADGKDTLYRIHGTNEPHSIGKAMSSGCIRMLNENIEELHLRVEVGTKVTVLSPDAAETPYAAVD